MEQYIPKSVVLAEIERIKSILGNPFCLNDTAKASWVARKDVCEDLLSFIDSTEVKEVDLEKEMSEYFVEHPNEFFSDKYKLFAKHFFELGLKAAQKGE
jgi:hypothetical protein